jgi:hypothetical protein
MRSSIRDAPLTDNGKRIARETAAVIVASARPRPTCVYVSKLRRCIVDKNARVGMDCMLTNRAAVMEANREEAYYIIKDGCARARRLALRCAASDAFPLQNYHHHEGRYSPDGDGHLGGALTPRVAPCPAFIPYVLRSLFCPSARLLSL